MRTGGFELGSSVLMSSTMKWLHRIQCGFNYRGRHCTCSRRPVDNPVIPYQSEFTYPKHTKIIPCQHEHVSNPSHMTLFPSHSQVIYSAWFPATRPRISDTQDKIKILSRFYQQIMIQRKQTKGHGFYYNQSTCISFMFSCCLNWESNPRPLAYGNTASNKGTNMPNPLLQNRRFNDQDRT
jgi:hypothetical protein